MRIARFAAAAALAASLSLTPSFALAQTPSWPSLSKAAPVQAEGANDAALIIGIDEYAFVPHVAGAAQNATDWYEQLVEGRKVPVGSVQLLRNREASRENILSKAAEVAKAVRPGGTLWVVFVGHGAPSQDGKEGVLVGVDAQQNAASLYARSVKQSDLYAAIDGHVGAHTFMLVDACFSGRTADGSAVAQGLQPLIVVRDAARLDPKTTLLTAGAADEFAGPLPGTQRPAFSYLVLGAMRGWTGKPEVSARDAVEYAQKALTVLPTGRSQHPALAGLSFAIAHGAADKGPDLVQEVAAPLPAVPGNAPPGALRVNFAAKDAGESWSLLDKNYKVLCRLPCTQWVSPNNGWKLRLDADKAEDVRTMPVPMPGYSEGRTVDAKAYGERHPLAWTLTGGFVAAELLLGLVPTVTGVWLATGSPAGSNATSESNGLTMLAIGGSVLAIALGLQIPAAILSRDDGVDYSLAKEAKTSLRLLPGAIEASTPNARMWLSPGGVAGTF